VLLAVLHFALGPLFDLWIAKPNLLLCAALLAARQLRPTPAVIVGFVLGLLQDAMAVSHFGLATILLVVITYLASQTRDLFLGEEPLFIGTYLVVGTWLYETIGYLLIGAGAHPISYLLLQVPLDSLATAAVGYLVLPLTRTK
jgi:rod shape-determining protein MreD